MLDEKYIDSPKFYKDANGWSQRAPISDEKCILICLRNCMKLDGMDRKQMFRMVEEWQVISDNTPDPPLPADIKEYDGQN